MLDKFKFLFRSNLPDGSPPEGFVDNRIEIEQESKPSHRPLYQFSPEKQIKAKDYIGDFRKRGKNSRRKSPYNATLLFVKNVISSEESCTIDISTKSRK